MKCNKGRKKVVYSKIYYLYFDWPKGGRLNTFKIMRRKKISIKKGNASPYSQKGAKRHKVLQTWRQLCSDLGNGLKFILTDPCFSNYSQFSNRWVRAVVNLSSISVGIPSEKSLKFQEELFFFIIFFFFLSNCCILSSKG